MTKQNTVTDANKQNVQYKNNPHAGQHVQSGQTHTHTQLSPRHQNENKYNVSYQNQLASVHTNTVTLIQNESLISVLQPCDCLACFET